MSLSPVPPPDLNLLSLPPSSLLSQILFSFPWLLMTALQWDREPGTFSSMVIITLLQFEAYNFANHYHVKDYKILNWRTSLQSQITFTSEKEYRYYFLKSYPETRMIQMGKYKVAFQSLFQSEINTVYSQFNHKVQLLTYKSNPTPHYQHSMFQ